MKITVSSSSTTPSRKPSRMVQGLLVTFAAGAVIFLGFQVGVYATHPKEERAVWGSREKSIVYSNNWFGLNLYNGLKEQEPKGKNLFFSPFSISFALAMTLLGARGRTTEQMIEVMHFDKHLSNEDIHMCFKTLQHGLASSNDNDSCVLHMANRIYTQQGISILEGFRKDTADFYSAESRNVDFESHTDAARLTINQWVEEVTREKIKDLLKPGVLSSLTKLVLVNAIYFKGTWASQFDTKGTTNANFYIDDKRSVNVDMMYQNGHFRNGWDNDLDAQVLELPYAGNDLSMLIVLPRDRNGLRSIEDKLSGDVSSLSSNLRNTSIAVYLPKFTMTCDFDLSKMLTLMGMKDLFSDFADLSGINGAKDLTVSHVIHKAHIEVNEEGTEAAAATAVVMTLRAMAPNVFRADHPFYFYIRHEKTNSILFMGKFIEPASAARARPKEDL